MATAPEANNRSHSVGKPTRTLKFDDAQAEDVAISDHDLETEDHKKRLAEKTARRRSRFFRQLHWPRGRRQQILLIGFISGLLIIGLAGWPASRWRICNLVGLSRQLELRLVNQQQQPVAGFMIELAGQSSKVSDADGRLKFDHLPYGRLSLVGQKTGYARLDRQLVNDFGRASHRTITVPAIGIKFDVAVRDWISGVPLEGAEVRVDSAVATTDQAGQVSLVLAPTDAATIQLAVSKPGYIARSVESAPTAKQRDILLVADSKDYFISGREGKLDLFSSNLDGSGLTKVLEATGLEQQSVLQLSLSPDNNRAILVATREPKVVNNQYIAGVYLIELPRGAVKKLDEGSYINLYGWIGSKLAYTRTRAGVDYEAADRSELLLLDAATSQITKVDSHNYFEAVGIGPNKLTYLYGDQGAALLTSYDLASKTKKTTNSRRSLGWATSPRYGFFEVSSNDGSGLVFEIGYDGVVKNLNRPPELSRRFVLNQDGSLVAWIDQRDGQGALMISGPNQTEKVVLQKGGLGGLPRFLTAGRMVVTVVTQQESADYVVDVASGKFSKISDVTATDQTRGGY